MNTTSKAILETVLSTDTSLSSGERETVERLISGKSSFAGGRHTDRLLMTQKEAGAMLSVSRVTIWRMTRDGALKPVEVLPGTWRYRFEEIATIAAGDAMAVRKPRQQSPRRFASVA